MLFRVWLVCFMVYCVVFFKQKTAYEVRISDWSSDVCSSDLQWHGQHGQRHGQQGGEPHGLPERDLKPLIENERSQQQRVQEDEGDQDGLHQAIVGGSGHDRARLAGCGTSYAHDRHLISRRSEEHTSELQSLMRISYAVFCLKKKTNHNRPIQQKTYN